MSTLECTDPKDEAASCKAVETVVVPRSRDFH